MKEKINCDIHATIKINKIRLQLLLDLGIWTKHKGIPTLNISHDAETPWNSINSQMHCTQNRHRAPLHSKRIYKQNPRYWEVIPITIQYTVQCTLTQKYKITNFTYWQMHISQTTSVTLHIIKWKCRTIYMFIFDYPTILTKTTSSRTSCFQSDYPSIRQNRKGTHASQPIAKTMLQCMPSSTYTTKI